MYLLILQYKKADFSILSIPIAMSFPHHLDLCIIHFFIVDQFVLGQESY